MKKTTPAEMLKRPSCPRCGKTGMRMNGPAASGKTRWQCDHRSGHGCGYSTTDPKALYVNTQSGRSGKRVQKQRFARKLTGISRFVITSAQNATPVHEGFFKALKAYCKRNGAELIVIPIRYKNPTSRWEGSQKNEDWWTTEVQPYLYNQRKNLNKNLILMADVKTRPTAESPLTGFEGITHGSSAIFGHSKLQLKTVPTPHNRLPKILTTTGSVTIRNYSDSKAGKKGEFHHTFGACAVDIRGSKFDLRQINATSDGSFIDYDTEYLATGRTKKAGRALGLIMGDTHQRFTDPRVLKATFKGKKSMVGVLDPEVLVWHDLLDGYSANPHHKDNPFIAIAKRKANMHIVADEVKETVAFLIKHTKGRKSVVVASNHDDFFRRWIMSTDWRRDSDNAAFYLETAKLMVDSTHMEEYGASTIDPFSYWVNKLKGDADITTLANDESYMVGPNECGFHGHRGPHGSRGTVKNLSRLGVRVISGHGHAPAIEEGHTRVGTSTYLRLEYNEGPSAWLNTHCVVYANGKRALLNIIEGGWRL